MAYVRGIAPDGDINDPLADAAGTFSLAEAQWAK
jgi:hypothetical protein